jgi:hypothetical protein
MQFPFLGLADDLGSAKSRLHPALAKRGIGDFGRR